MSRTPEHKSLESGIFLRWVLDAGLVVGSFAALPAAVLASQGVEAGLQTMLEEPKETLTLLALSGMILSGVTVGLFHMVTDISSSRAAGREMDAELSANQVAGLDAGVPVVGEEAGTEEIHE